jgi:CHAD domain-containing protein
VTGSDGILEQEVKLSPSADLDLGRLPGEALEERSFLSSYYDTDDRVLAGLGITLRRRVEHGLSLWQLKLPRSGGRLELERPGGPAGPPRRIAAVLASVLRGRELRPVAELRTLRRGVRVHENESTADVVVDEVAVMEDLRVVHRFDELEIELIEGDAGGLRAIEKMVRHAGAGDGDPRPKVLRIIGAPPEPRKTSQLQAFFARQYREILLHDPGTRLGDDPDDLHDLRVAVRRLRAILKVAAPPLDEEWADSLREELNWLGNALGAVRDLDVLLAHLRTEQESFPRDEAKAFNALLIRLELERTERRKELLDLMRSPRYSALLDRLEDAARRPPTRSARPRARAIAAREFRKLRKAVRKLGDDPSDEALHRARIKGKRARYAAELAAPRVGKKAEKVVSAAKVFQDVTGEHQDAVVAVKRLRMLAADGTQEGAFAAGRIAERQEERKRAARSDFPRAWRKLEQAGKRAWK